MIWSWSKGCWFDPQSCHCHIMTQDKLLTCHVPQSPTGWRLMDCCWKDDSWLMKSSPQVAWTDATIHQQSPSASQQHSSPIKPTSVSKWWPLRAKNETYNWHESVFCRSTRTWNTLPADLKWQPRTATFKWKLKTFLFECSYGLNMSSEQCSAPSVSKL